MGTIYIYSVLSMGSIAALLATGLGVASKFFRVEADPRIDEVEEALPGADCGACGYGGCRAFAEAVVAGEAEITGCPVGGEPVADQIAEILGEDSGTKEEETAQLLCQGSPDQTTSQGDYEGPESCKACEVINGGPKDCDYGCLGFGDCEQICPFDAIVMGEDELPKIDPQKCTACGKCVEICPKDILILAPLTGENHIRCFSNDPGSKVSKICEVGCIACGLCVKECPVDAIEIKNNLAVLDYEKCINCGLCSLVCPTGTIDFSGRIIEEIEITDECVGCTRCAQECPVEAITGEVKQKHEIDPEECVKCGICSDVCAVEGAIKVVYREDENDD
ncbi:MAG: RnfABCDGE type electron transport complex subunit B [Bacillota bacterium]